MRRFPQSILQRVGIRQLPGIYRYPAKGTGQTVKQGGTADKRLFVLDRICSVGDFCFYSFFDSGQRSFFHGGFIMVLLTKRWRRGRFPFVN